MQKFKKKGPEIIEAIRFDPHKGWPDMIIPWDMKAQPRDMSWGYIDRPGEGRIHIRATDWIFKDENGMWDALSDQVFRQMYETE